MVANPLTNGEALDGGHFARYVHCSSCGARCSQDVKAPGKLGIVVRAWVECPECLEKATEDECNHLSMDGLGFGDLWVCMACARICKIVRDDEILSRTVALEPDEVKEALAGVVAQ